MATGYDEEGVEEIICVDPPGGEGDGDDDDILTARPNVFAGHYPRNAEGPSIAIGTDDFSLEFWICRRSQAPAVADPTETGVGLQNGLNDPTVRFSDSGTGTGHFWRYMNNAGGNLSTAASAQVTSPGWHHYAGNFDRDGNLTTYRDSALLTTDALPDAGAPANLGNLNFQPLSTYLIGLPLYYVYLLGPVALHVGAGSLLTTDEMAASVAGKTVQINSTTQVAYFWNDVDGVDEWDTVNITPAIAWGQPFTDRLFLAPEGTTVIVRDASGSGNHWTLPTSAEYTSLVLSESAFSWDRFWV